MFIEIVTSSILDVWLGFECAPDAVAYSGYNKSDIVDTVIM